MNTYGIYIKEHPDAPCDETCVMTIKAENSIDAEVKAYKKARRKGINLDFLTFIAIDINDKPSKIGVQFGYRCCDTEPVTDQEERNKHLSVKLYEVAQAMISKEDL